MEDKSVARQPSGWNRPKANVPQKRQAFKLNPRIVWGAVGLVAAIVLAAVCWPTGGEESQTDGRAARRGKLLQSGRIAPATKMSPKEAVRSAMKPIEPAKRKKKSPFGRVRLDAIYTNLKGKDRKLAEDLQRALDDEDAELARVAADSAMKSEDPEVRRYAIDALGWFGAEMLPELTAAMADPDSDVSDSAENAWEQAVGEIEDSGERFAITAAAIASLSSEDQLTSISGVLSGAADEFIDGPEDEAEQAQNRLTVVQALVDIIDSGAEKNVEQAKDVYCEITGEDWSGVDAAEAYLYDQYDYDAAAAEKESADEPNEAAVAEDVEQGGEL